MYVHIVPWLILVAVSVLFGWLTWRAWRAKNAFLKWGGVVVSGLLTLIIGLVAVVSLIGLVKFYMPRNIPVPDLKVEGTPEQVARGKYLAVSFCTGCHSADNELPLTGGMDLGKDFPVALGSFVSANLTPAGPLKDWSDGEIFRALRNGMDRDGHWLVLMSNVRVRHLSDEDLKALIAYLRSQPAVVNETQTPLDQPNFLAAVMLGAGMLPEGQAPIMGVITAPPKGPTEEYGQYLLSYQDCRDCHGEDLTGGKEGQFAPIGPSLRVVKGWTKEQFVATVRTGVDPGGNALSDQMPWKALARMDDEDLAAMYAFLSNQP